MAKETEETSEVKRTYIAREGIKVDPDFLYVLDEEKGKDAINFQGLRHIAFLIAKKLNCILSGKEPIILAFPHENPTGTIIIKAGYELKDKTTGEIIEEWWGIGDADEYNVDELVKPHIPRIGETRAKVRALRDLTDVPLVAMEELGGQGRGQQRRRSGTRKSSAARNEQEIAIVELKEKAKKFGIKNNAALIKFVADTLGLEVDEVSSDNLTVEDIEKCVGKLSDFDKKEVREQTTGKGRRASEESSEPTEKKTKAKLSQEILEKAQAKGYKTPSELKEAISNILERDVKKCTAALLTKADLQKVYDELDNYPDA